MSSHHLSSYPEWEALQNLAKRKKSLRQLFQNKKRFKDYSIKNNILLFDYSKNNLENKHLKLIFRLFQKLKLKEKIKSMYNGEKINFTEKRAALHPALRNFQNHSLINNDIIKKKIAQELNKMKVIAEKVITQKYRGYSNQPITDIVNIGIGGSYLGVKLATQSLKPYSNHLRVHFISNIDGIASQEILNQINPATTLFIVVSKSFTTIETITNANTIKKWLKGKSPYPMQNFFAITSNQELALKWEISRKNILNFGDYIGGRYSLFSPVGLTVMLSIGYSNFKGLLNGAQLMDEHFLKTNYHANLPIILAALGIWQINFLGNINQLILPYSHLLRFLPNYLQQLDMESNGKNIDKNSQKVKHLTGPFLWGEVGTNGQHSFYQSLHQGTHLFTADFIGIKKVKNTFPKHHTILLANLIAQSEALAFGLNEKEFKQKNLKGHFSSTLLPHRLFTGDKPSNTFILQKLNPKTLGYLIALYEHKIFVQGVFWGINSFDQWGVELGKSIAQEIEKKLKSNKKDESKNYSTHNPVNFSASTLGLVTEIKKK